VSPAHFLNLLESVVASPHLELAGICSHLAKADDIDFTNKQKVIFQNCLKKTKDRYPHILKSCGGTVLAHLASSDAARRFPDTHFDMVRAGLMLYGLESRAISNVVQPVMSVRARISQVNDVDEGEGVGYNLTWTAARPSRLASIPVGYADGVNRKLSNKMYGILRGKLVNQVGTISMDQMLFDVTDIRDASEGEIITLIGSDGSETIFLADWAEKLETITYEVACAMRMRLPRIYVGATAP
jgi:alanine racemase